MGHQELEVEVGEIPNDVEAFLALRNRLATTPEGGAAVFAVALVCLTRDEELGRAALTIAIDRSQLSEGAKGYKGFQPSNMELQSFKERIAAKPYVALSYLAGTAPEAGYALPVGPLTVKIRNQGLAHERSEDTAKLFVHSTGADSPRPLALVKNNRGLWKAKGWSSLTVGVRPPVEVVDDDL